MLRRVVWRKLIDVSEVFTASITTATSLIRLHGETTQKSVVFIFVALRT
jgi:hypothetical protein